MSNMNKIYLTILSLLSFFMYMGCTHNFDSINENPFGVDNEVMASGGISEGLANHCSVMEGIVIPTQENLYQYVNSLGCETLSGYMGQTKHTDLGKYNFNIGFISYPFTDEQSLPKLIKEYNSLTLETNADKENLFFAIGTVLKVSIMQRLTDMYGPQPYDFGGTSAQKPYQDTESIYRKMVEDLSWAIRTLKEIEPSNSEKVAWSTSDKVYSGDFGLWAKYAASLKLRLAIRCSNAIPEEAKIWGEEAIRTGVISENSEIAQFATNDNQFVKMSNTWGDTRVGADIVSYMVAYDDPRLSAYFTPTNRAGKDIYFGLRSGVDIPEKETLIKPGVYSITNEKKESPMIWMTAAEVAFLKSEGALKGWDMGDEAKSLYKKGIELSMAQHKQRIGDYLNNTGKRGSFVDSKFPQFNNEEFSSNIIVRWNEVDKEANLAQIITQKYIAMFPYGSAEAWAEWRRTGYPNLLPPIDYNHDVKSIDRDQKGRDIRGYRRYPFPPTEYKVNNNNVNHAVSSFLHGNDSPNTNPWWGLKY